jgi:NADH dehydrogenase FAD-containing subunit
MTADPQPPDQHWDRAYTDSDQHSWDQQSADVSIALLEEAGLATADQVLKSGPVPRRWPANYKKENITAHASAALDHVAEDAVVLSDGTEPSAFTMAIPPFVGQEVVRSNPLLTDEKGYVKVRPTYQSEKYDDMYAVGIAAAVEVPWQSAAPVGIPKTGYPTEAQAHVAAKNIAAQIRDGVPNETKSFADIHAVCVMDAATTA